MDLDLPAFRMIVWPVIEELHRKSNGMRPTPEELTRSTMLSARRDRGVGRADTTRARRLGALAARQGLAGTVAVWAVGWNS